MARLRAEIRRDRDLHEVDLIPEITLRLINYCNVKVVIFRFRLAIYELSVWFDWQVCNNLKKEV
jgi:hypothetical protein